MKFIKLTTDKGKTELINLANVTEIIDTGDNTVCICFIDSQSYQYYLISFEELEKIIENITYEKAKQCAINAIDEVINTGALANNHFNINNLTKEDI